MSTVLHVASDGAPLELLHQETMALAQLLERQPDLVVERPEDGPIAPGQRGGLLAIGSLILSNISAQGVEALANLLKLFFETRSPEITLTFKGRDGEECHLSARNFEADHLVDTVAKLRSVLHPAT